MPRSMSKLFRNMDCALRPSRNRYSIAGKYYSIQDRHSFDHQLLVRDKSTVEDGYESESKRAISFQCTSVLVRFTGGSNVAQIS